MTGHGWNSACSMSSMRRGAPEPVAPVLMTLVMRPKPDEDELPAEDG